MKRNIVTRSMLVIAAAAISWPWAGPASASSGTGLVGADTAATGSASSWFAQVSSVSCASAGSCAAVGFFNAGGISAFVVDQTQGTWGRAQRVRGLAAVPGGGATQAYLTSVSCWSPGNCAAGGDYLGQSNAWHPFVVTQANGTWGRAKEIALPSPHSGGDLSEVEFVSCQAAGDCTAAGFYSSKSKSLPFVLTEYDGTWGRAEDLPRDTRLSPSGEFVFDTLSCASVGNCAAGGSYLDATGSNYQAFVVTERNGAWGKAREVPGTAAVNTGGSAAAEWVSCPAAGSCLAVGSYTGSGDGLHPFISSQKNGTWGHIQRVPGLVKFWSYLWEPDLPWAWCASPGNCTAIGNWVAGGISHSFSVTEKNGTWRDARRIRLGARSDIGIESTSCVSIGNCSAGGYFTGPGSQEVFVITETNGIWGKAEQVPGSVKLNHGGYADMDSVACGAPGDCTAGGVYTPKWPQEEPFLVTQTNGLWGNMTKVAGLP
jgi:hypothetical protein